MPTDDPIPLATFEDLSGGPFADLVSGYTSTTAQTQLMLEATRACESECDRRFAPFTGITETQRAEGVDVEDVVDAYVPQDPTSQLGADRALSLGSTMLVRHFWVDERPPRYSEMWTGTISGITLLRSYSGTQTLDVAGIQYEPDTGHVRMQLGSFVPPGTTIQVVYSGGYTTVPADLVRACKLMAASLAARELDPVQMDARKDPDALADAACRALKPYMRGGRM
jgi:hypothetical protein